MPTRTETHARQDEALRLREVGYDLATIASRLGWNASYTGATSRAIKTARLRRDAAAGFVGRRFGVELEIAGLTVERAAAALRSAGINVRAEGYNHHTRTYWKVLTDASVMGGCEVVTPPLRGEAGMTELRTAMAALRAAGATVNSSCGMHVHVDMDGLTGDQIARTVEAYTNRQDTIDRMVAPSRRATGNVMYCRRMSAGEVEAVTMNFRESRQAPRYTDRYRTVNVSSFPKYGTVEFRQHQGTVSSRKAVAWIRMLLGLVEAVEAGTDTTLSIGAGMLGDLADASEMFRTQDAAFLGARMEELAR